VVQRRFFRGWAVTVPEGDLVVGVERLLVAGRALLRRPARAPAATEADRWTPLGPPAEALLRAEAGQRRLPAVGLALLVVGALLWGLVYWARVG
jgi:hypothetical protein